MRAVTGRARPLLVDRIDTDVIAPQSELVVVDRAGLGHAAFKCWRDAGAPRPAAAEPLVDPAYAGAPILLAGAEFGCGSSREHAVWALLGFGVEAVVAPSFGEIFLRNALRNHLVVVAVDADDLELLAAGVQRHTDVELTVDLEAGAVTAPLPSGEVRAPFTLDDAARRFLVDEADEITDTLALLAAHGRGEVTGA